MAQYNEGLSIVKALPYGSHPIVAFSENKDNLENWIKDVE